MDARINFTKFNKFQGPRPLEDKFWEKVTRGGLEDCWEWKASITKDGYGCFASKLAHRVSWEIHFGPIPKKLYVCHRCDNPSCVNPNHLFLGTQQDNMNDMVKKGRGSDKFGERNPKAKLTSEDVRDIHILYSLGVNIKSLAREFKVTSTTIRYILSGKSWKSIYGEYHAQ